MYDDGISGQKQGYAGSGWLILSSVGEELESGADWFLEWIAQSSASSLAALNSPTIGDGKS